ncbi:DUF3870 domain-containing protein [Mycolicibacterium agri]|uniref:DUF3870 domain-containing protein n=1 Tax=Mycolicibacterium agri TaxID=36811 RepID=UPI0013D00431|nr:DUF3870 domain-containing protein [Mycolicibacterium agri]
MDHEVIVIGHSMMPKGTATRDVHENLSMVVLVDLRTHKVQRASVALTTEVNREWVESRLTGQDLREEPARFVTVVESNYWGPAQRALVQCYRDLVRRYQEGLRDAGIDTSSA